jgi:hypothetical protein
MEQPPHISLQLLLRSPGEDATLHGTYFRRFTVGTGITEQLPGDCLAKGLLCKWFLGCVVGETGAEQSV